MHKTVATKDGGVQVDLSLEEENKIKAEWKENQARQKAEEAAEREEKKAAKEAMDILTKDLNPKQRKDLEKRLGFNA